MSNAEILESLLEKPNAIKIIEAAQSVLETEKLARSKFYELNHDNFKAEFINGEIVFQAPATLRELIVSTNLISLLHLHVSEKRLGMAGAEKVMIRLTRNDYQPDLCFFKNEKAGKFTPDQELFPEPDFIIEVLSGSSEKVDREIKFIDYAAHGVTEYWIVDPLKKTVEKYLLQQGEYTLDVKLHSEGRLQSYVVEGFVVELKELFE